ncbi:hypothetical protein WICPIJ_007253 [Wickerhamomyces pijperi]|uniref:Uncharacterized protein n=1 Tax=Wickerhamomyces pijperi TaxID=599730 RepID=A0A9P8TJG5_WICPI|nr:hypothetical protein WICPIJ_007253 [Wickerhamomyces pijperi]
MMILLKAVNTMNLIIDPSLMASPVPYSSGFESISVIMSCCRSWMKVESFRDSLSNPVRIRVFVIATSSSLIRSVG